MLKRKVVNGATKGKVFRDNIYSLAKREGPQAVVLQRGRSEMELLSARGSEMTSTALLSVKILLSWCCRDSCWKILIRKGSHRPLSREGMSGV